LLWSTDWNTYPLPRVPKDPRQATYGSCGAMREGVEAAQRGSGGEKKGAGSASGHASLRAAADAPSRVGPGNGSSGSEAGASNGSKGAAHGRECADCCGRLQRDAYSNNQWARYTLNLEVRRQKWTSATCRGSSEKNGRQEAALLSGRGHRAAPGTLLRGNP